MQQQELSSARNAVAEQVHEVQQKKYIHAYFTGKI
jgi:hypothetical protein